MMSLNYSQVDETLIDKAREKIRKMFFSKCFMERWDPIQRETNWTLTGRPNEKHHRKILPEYCYNIIDLQRRTTYKAFSPLSEVIKFKNKKRARKAKSVAEAKKAMTIDFEKLGAVFGMGDRCQIFFENEIEQKLRQTGLLKPKRKQEFELYQMIFGKEWLDKKLAEIQAGAPKKSLEEILEEKASAQRAKIKQAVPVWHERAREWSPEALTHFHAGVAKGSEGFLGHSNELKGEKKIKLRDTYDTLLLAWPEIKEMMGAKPQKTRIHLWEWLRPFSHARWIEIEDLEQLNRLCNEIKLRLKKPGAPFKVK
jgi:hypothetical protein